MTEFSTIPLTTPRFYRHSGRAPANAIIAGAFASVFAGLILGAVYGFVQLYLHLAPGKIMIAGIIGGIAGFSLALGHVPAFVLNRFKARSVPVAVACASLATLSGLYAAWVFFIFALGLHSNTDVNLLMIARPDSLAHIISDLDGTGVWSLFDANTFPSGIILALIWIAELFIILTVALRVVIRQVNKQTFCENCLTWGTSRKIMEISDENWPGLQKSLAAGNLEAIAGVMLRKYGSPSWCDISIEGCPTCDNVQTLNLTRTVVTPAKKKKNSIKTKHLVRRLILSPEQTVQIALAAAALKTLPSSPPAAA